VQFVLICLHKSSFNTGQC